MGSKLTGRLNQRGSSLVELVIFTSISLMVLTGAYDAYSTFYQGTVRTQTRARTQDDARRILEQTLRELRMAGYGLPKATNPAPLSPITAASTDSIGFLTNDGGPVTSLTATATAGSTAMSVASTSGFQVNDTVFVADQATYHAATITAVGPSMTILPAVPVDFAAGATVTRQPRQIMYSFAGGILYRDAGTGAGAQPWLADLGSLTFSFFDGSNNPVVMPGGDLTTIRRVVVQMTSSGSVPGPAYTVQSETWIRN